MSNHWQADKSSRYIYCAHLMDFYINVSMIVLIYIGSIIISFYKFGNNIIIE